MPTLTHTPTPWEARGPFITDHEGNQLLAVLAMPPDRESGIANQAFTLKAVNSHAALLEALRDLVKQTTEYINDYREDLPDVTQARAAIRQAEGR